MKDMRFAHRLWSCSVDPRNLVFIDETGMHLRFTRLYGRAPKGERLYDTKTPAKRGQNISLIGGMSINGLIATMSIVGSVNTEVFLYGIE
ncbi:transposase [Phormidium sp. CLA17]|nr:transposase [Leptolyngbya sp. Cla-17]